MANESANKQHKISETKSSPENKNEYVSQSDVPSYPLEKALRVPQTICDNYAKHPTKPLRVAEGMGILPTSSSFRMLCGASIAYGLTQGGYNAETITITPLARKIFSPTNTGDDLQAKREAILKPRIVNEFLKKYNGSALPPENIAKNVIEEMGVPQNRTQQTYDLILQNASYVGFLRNMGDKKFVDIDWAESESSQTIVNEESKGQPDMEMQGEVNKEISPPSAQRDIPPVTTGLKKRVFITHGKNTQFIETIKKLLSFGELEPVVVIEKQSVSQPVPDKVMETMRSCGAAIIHVDAEEILLTKSAEERVVLNPNVMIEIGAAMALYGRRFILLVKDGVKLPSNLQGLYELRYSADTLDGDTTIKLLEAIKTIKDYDFPERYQNNASN